MGLILYTFASGIIGGILWNIVPLMDGFLEEEKVLRFIVTGAMSALWPVTLLVLIGAVIGYGVNILIALFKQNIDTKIVKKTEENE